MKTLGHVDWLAVTFPASTHPLDLFPMVISLSPLTEKGKGPHGYNTLSTNELGVIVLSNGAENQGVHAILSGTSLENIRAEGVTDRQLANNILANSGRVARLDVALDLLEGTLTVDDLQRAYENRQARTIARAATVIQKLDTPEHTLYMGSRASMRFFRAYNKGAQVKSEEAWLRLELETKKLVAGAINMAIARTKDTRKVINRAITDYVDFPGLPEYQQATHDRDATIPRVPRKMTNTYRWLIESVAPTLAKYAYEHPNDQVWSAFYTAYLVALRELDPNLDDVGPQEAFSR